MSVAQTASLDEDQLKDHFDGTFEDDQFEDAQANETPVTVQTWTCYTCFLTCGY